jgi:hypothetical protein
MAALVFQKIQGAVLNCIESTDKKATYEAKRPGGKLTTMSFTWEDAVKAGVTGKDNWKNYAPAMLRARSCSAICRVVFPDAIMGVYTPDELGAIVNEEGDPIIDVTPEPALPPVVEEPAISAKDELLEYLSNYCRMQDDTIDPELEATVLKQIGAVDKDGAPATIDKLYTLDAAKHKNFFKKLLKAWLER